MRTAYDSLYVSKQWPSVLLLCDGVRDVHVQLYSSWHAQF